MEIGDADLIYYFSFKVPGLGSKEYFNVFSIHKHMIYKFISTHFDEDLRDYIHTCEVNEVTDKFGSISPDYLKYYYLKNNELDKMYMIATTPRIIDEITSMVGNTISFICEFGEVITQTDIPIFRALQENLLELPFIDILDNQKVDGKTYYPMKNKTDRNSDTENYDDDEYDDSFIFETIHEAVINTESEDKTPLPFTLKAYVSNFTKLLFDPRDWG